MLTTQGSPGLLLAEGSSWGNARVRLQGALENSQS